VVFISMQREEPDQGVDILATPRGSVGLLFGTAWSILRVTGVVACWLFVARVVRGVLHVSPRNDGA